MTDLHQPIEKARTSPSTCSQVPFSSFSSNGLCFSETLCSVLVCANHADLAWFGSLNHLEELCPPPDPPSEVLHRTDTESFTTVFRDLCGTVEFQHQRRMPSWSTLLTNPVLQFDHFDPLISCCSCSWNARCLRSQNRFCHTGSPA